MSDWSAKSFNWSAIWSPQILQSFAQSVTIAGASYQDSLGGRLALRWCNAEVIKNDTMRQSQPEVKIGYFTEKHKGSSAFWSKSEGRARIVKVCEYLQRHAPSLGYWSGNEPVKILMEHRLAGEMISAKSAGLNSYDHCTECAFIYSSKATPADAAMKSVLRFTDEDILRAREHEDIFQFVFRGAIRRSDYAGPYNIYLYSRDQAEALERRLRENGFSEVTLVPLHDAGLMDDLGPNAQKPKPRPAKVHSTRTGKSIKAESEKRAERRRKQAAGKPPTKRGRPRKSQ